MQVTIGQTFSFEQETKPINGMFEIGLGWCDAPLLEHKEILMDLFAVEFGGDFAIMQRDGRNMHGIVFESTWAAAKYRNTTLKTVD